MPLYRIVTVPLEIRCRHAADEPSLAQLVEWLRDGGLEVDINIEGNPSSVADFVHHVRIVWSEVIESLGHRRSPWADQNEVENH